MNDVLLALLWVLTSAVGLAACVKLRAAGVAATYVRDLLHVGAGVWIFGWPLWSGVLAPVVIVLSAFALVASVRSLGRWGRAVVEAVTGNEERWSGIVAYTASFALFTVVGLTVDPFPAAIALLALAIGDGVGGLVGRTLGRRRIRVPGAKPKTIEGSLAVGAGALAAVWIAGLALGRSVHPGAAALIALTTALVEAVSPRSTDNLTVPTAAWLVATILVQS